MAKYFFSNPGPKRPMKRVTKSLSGPKKHLPNKTSFKPGQNKAIYSKVPCATEKSLGKPTYKQLYNLIKPPTDPKERLKLGKKFLAWSLLPDTLIWQEFPIQEGIVPSAFKWMCSKDDVFKDYFEMSIAALAAKRERIIGKDLMRAMHPLYDREWRDYQESKHEAKQNDHLVYVPLAVERTNQVPEKK